MGDLPAVKSIACANQLRALKPLEINLLDFYDGAQLFIERTCCFWGGFTSIINLAPTYRCKVGISAILSAEYEELRTLCESLRPLYPLEHNDEEEQGRRSLFYYISKRHSFLLYY